MRLKKKKKGGGGLRTNLYACVLCIAATLVLKDLAMPSRSYNQKDPEGTSDSISTISLKSSNTNQVD